MDAIEVLHHGDHITTAKSATIKDLLGRVDCESVTPTASRAGPDALDLAAQLDATLLYYGLDPHAARARAMLRGVSCAALRLHGNSSGEHNVTGETAE